MDDKDYIPLVNMPPKVQAGFRAFQAYESEDILKIRTLNDYKYSFPDNFDCLLEDLMHFADFADLDFEERLATAYRLYRQNKAKE